MSDSTPGITPRKPDCVAEVRKGNTVLTVYGYFKLDASETAADKMARVIASSANLGENVICNHLQMLLALKPNQDENFSS